MKIEFGAYAQVFEDNYPTYTVQTRTTGEIALTTMGNAQGGYYFLSLTTRRRLSRQQWDKLPMLDGMIAAIEVMAMTDQQPLLRHGAPIFEWSPGILVDNNNNAPAMVKEHGADIGYIEEIVDEDDSTDDDGAALKEEEEIIEGNKADGDEPDNVPVLLDDADKRCVGSRNDVVNEGIVEQRSNDKGTDKEIATEQETPGIGRYNLRSNRARNYCTKTGLTIKSGKFKKLLEYPVPAAGSHQRLLP
jgi:hypothetical protein